MPKIKEELSVKLNNYIKEFGDVLTSYGNTLLCKACNKEIKNPFKKFMVRQHLATNSHLKALKSFTTNEEFLDENTINDNEFDCHKSDSILINDLKLENGLIENVLHKEMNLITILELIKDKVLEIVDECKCHYNNDVKNEVKDLIEEYDRKKKIMIQNNDNKKDFKVINLKKFSINKTNGKNTRNRKNINKNEGKDKKKSLIKPKVENKMKRKAKNQTKDELSEELLLEKEKRSLGNNYLCPWPGCDKRYSLKSQLKPHLRIHTGEKKFKCNYPECDKTYDRRSTLVYHLEKHKCETYRLEKTVRCEYADCQKMFAFKYQMNHHIRVNHLKIIRFKCEWPSCDSGFVSKVQYDSHVGQCHIGQNLYKCDWPDCGKRFSTRANLFRHNNYIHLKQKKYKCDFKTCGKSFTRKEQLELHTIDAHNGQKPLSCDWPGCEFSTLYSCNLKSHKMRHTGERPYKCSWPSCLWSFRQSDHLKTHMLKHTGERPVTCHYPNCDSRFQSRHAMKVHFDRTHTNSSYQVIN